MLRGVRLQTIAILAVGALLGYLAASERTNLSAKALAAPTAADGTNELASTQPVGDPGPVSCSDGLSKGALLALASPKAGGAAAGVQASGKKPNIVFIMGDDIGWFNIGAYHRGMMAGRTPNLDQLAAQGMLFTDYYAEASCTAGRANFITGQLPIRTGLTTVGQAGATIGMPAQAPTIATALKSMGYATGQFGKNHLGDLQRVPADGARLRRVLRLPLSPRRDGRPGPPQLSAGAEGQGRPAQHAPQLGHRSGRPDRAAALGQGRQAEDRGRRHALSQADGDRRRRDPRARAQVHRQGQERRQAVLRLAQPHAHARRHAPLGEVREDAHAGERLVASRKPAWRSSTTSSAR